MRRGRAALVGGLLLLAGTAAAVQPDEVLPDRQLEARARGITGELRCLVCQNQSIDDSDAPLARDLRLLVRERLKAGDSDGAVRRFVVDRYGDFILLKPPFSSRTLLLWLGPGLMVAAAAAGLVLARRRGQEAASPPLSPADRAELDRLLRDEDASGRLVAGDRPGGAA